MSVCPSDLSLALALHYWSAFPPARHTHRRPSTRRRRRPSYTAPATPHYTAARSPPLCAVAAAPTSPSSPARSLTHPFLFLSGGREGGRPHNTRTPTSLSSLCLASPRLAHHDVLLSATSLHLFLLLRSLPPSLHSVRLKQAMLLSLLSLPLSPRRQPSPLPSLPTVLLLHRRPCLAPHALAASSGGNGRVGVETERQTRREEMANKFGSGVLRSLSPYRGLALTQIASCSWRNRDRHSERGATFPPLLFSLGRG